MCADIICSYSKYCSFCFVILSHHAHWLLEIIKPLTFSSTSKYKKRKYLVVHWRTHGYIHSETFRSSSKYTIIQSDMDSYTNAAIDNPCNTINGAMAYNRPKTRPLGSL